MGGGGGAVHFRPHTKSGRGGSPLHADIRKVGGGGGGGPVRLMSDTFVWHTEDTLSLKINGYNLDRGGGGGGGAQAPGAPPMDTPLTCM